MCAKCIPLSSVVTIFSKGEPDVVLAVDGKMPRLHDVNVVEIEGKVNVYKTFSLIILILQLQCLFNWGNA